jgi:hypothetical protein
MEGERMNIPQVVKATALFVGLSLFSMCASAQSLHILSQEGSVYASASATEAGETTFDSELKPVPLAGPIDVFAGAGASLPELSSSATSHLEVSFAPRQFTLSGSLDGNGSVTFASEQSAGGSAFINLKIMFQVDAPVYFTLTGENQGVWTGDASVDETLWLESTTEYIVDMLGPGARLEYQGILVPGETYSLNASGLASAMTELSDLSAFSSAQGLFTLSLTLGAAAVPEPGPLALLMSLGGGGITMLARRRSQR